MTAKTSSAMIGVWVRGLTFRRKPGALPAGIWAHYFDDKPGIPGSALLKSPRRAAR
jgi:hypothetical protein